MDIKRGKLLAENRSKDKNSLIVGVTTCDKNTEYFKLCYESLLRQEGNFNIKIVVIDFSENPSEGIVEEMGLGPATYVFRPKAGFCSNLNYLFSLALLAGFDYVGYVNDDVILPGDFFKNGVELVSALPVRSFVAGVQQETNEVSIPPVELAKMDFPKPEKMFQKIETLQGKWGDFSAWVTSVDLIKAVGNMDEAFDPVGLIADNDYLWRIRRLDCAPIRSYMMPYLHAKGVTQRSYRPNFPYDAVGVENRTYFKEKWGTDPYSGLRTAPFEQPFNKDSDYEEGKNGI